VQKVDLSKAEGTGVVAQLMCMRACLIGGDPTQCSSLFSAN